MDAPGRPKWLRAAILFGLVYVAVGLAFAALAGTAVSDPVRVAWRLAAWFTSAVTFAVHIGYEHVRLRNSPPKTALHAAVAAALGAFGLAVAANVHALWAPSSRPGLLALALLTWPALTAVPAFAVALAVAAVLARMRRRG